MRMISLQIEGRAWVYEDEHDELEVWEYAFVPMALGRRSGSAWAREYFTESCSNKLREIFNLPVDGNFQVIFKGKMIGYFSPSHDGDEWEDEFELEESRHEEIPELFMKLIKEPGPNK